MISEWLLSLKQSGYMICLSYPRSNQNLNMFKINHNMIFGQNRAALLSVTWFKLGGGELSSLQHSLIHTHALKSLMWRRNHAEAFKKVNKSPGLSQCQFVRLAVNEGIIDGSKPFNGFYESLCVTGGCILCSNCLLCLHKSFNLSDCMNCLSNQMCYVCHLTPLVYWKHDTWKLAYIWSSNEP